MVRDLARYLRRCARELAHFRRSQQGATAVEFALIAPAFLAMLIAVLQTCVFVFAQQTLQNAAVQAGRLIMTGQVQNGNVTQSQFLNSICPMIRPLFNCNSLIIDVQSYTSFSGADTSTPQLNYDGQQQLVVRSRHPRTSRYRAPDLPMVRGQRAPGIRAFQSPQQLRGDDGDLRLPGGALLIMPGPARLCRRFVASTRAIAAIEFAIVMPVLALMFFGTFDAGRAIAIYMKIRSATFAIDAITNQYTTVQTSDLQSIAGAAAVILAPYPSSTSVLTVTVSQVKITAANTATVSWSYSLGGSARSRGSAVTAPGTLGTCSSYPCYLIFGEMSYQYTPMFGFFTTAANITLSDNLFATPRSSKCVLYPTAGVNSC
jgi:Flp pilus assembly protein TadG